MSSKKKKPAAKSKKQPTRKPAAKQPTRKPAAKPPASAPAGGLTKGQKATLSRFARELVDEFKDRPNVTFYKVKRALFDSDLVPVILERGSRAWLTDGFGDGVLDLIDNLPSTAFRQPMTPEQRTARREADQAALLADVRRGNLSAVTLRAMRRAYGGGLKGEARTAARAAFDAAVAQARK